MAEQRSELFLRGCGSRSARFASAPRWEQPLLRTHSTWRSNNPVSSAGGRQHAFVTFRGVHAAAAAEVRRCRAESSTASRAEPQQECALTPFKAPRLSRSPPDTSGVEVTARCAARELCRKRGVDASPSRVAEVTAAEEPRWTAEHFKGEPSRVSVRRDRRPATLCRRSRTPRGSTAFLRAVTRRGREDRPPLRRRRPPRRRCRRAATSSSAARSPLEAAARPASGAEQLDLIGLHNFGLAIALTPAGPNAAADGKPNTGILLLRESTARCRGPV